MNITFDPDFESDIARQVEYRAGLSRVAEEVVQIAKGIAPKPGTNKYATGDYMKSIQVKLSGPNVYVAATDWKALLIEKGTVDTPTFAPLRRAVFAKGLRLKESKRERAETLASAADLGEL